MKKDRKPKLDYKGLPINPNDWTEADWRDLHEATESVIKKVAARHKPIENTHHHDAEK